VKRKDRGNWIVFWTTDTHQGFHGELPFIFSQASKRHTMTTCSVHLAVSLDDAVLDVLLHHETQRRPKHEARVHKYPFNPLVGLRALSRRLKKGLNKDKQLGRTESKHGRLTHSLARLVEMKLVVRVEPQGPQGPQGCQPMFKLATVPICRGGGRRGGGVNIVGVVGDRRELPHPMKDVLAM
jgi:hypothetical protein